MIIRTFIAVGLLSAAAGAAMASDAGTYSGRDAATSIGEALIKAGAGDEVKVSIYGAGDDTIMATAGGSVGAEVDNVDLDKSHNRWSAELLLTADGKNLAPLKLSGRYDEMTQLPVLKRRIESGQIIGMDDVEMSPWPATNLRKSTVTDARDLIGKSPKHVISQERPIRADEVASPPVILKGAHVTLIYKTPVIEIKTLGEAMENGARGDVIRVKNITSKSVIEGTVQSSDSVRVSSPENTSAEAM